MPETNAWIRLTEARPLIDWLIKAAIAECGIAVHVLPEELLSNRVALTHFLAEQLHKLADRKAQELEECWETQRAVLSAAVSNSNHQSTKTPKLGCPQNAETPPCEIPAPPRPNIPQN